MVLLYIYKEDVDRCATMVITNIISTIEQEADWVADHPGMWPELEDTDDMGFLWRRS